MEHHSKCPNCSRSLTESELYCYFCEMDIEKLNKMHSKNPKNKKIQQH